MTPCRKNATINTEALMLKSIITAPGRALIKRFPDLGPEETRLLHNVANYVVWLTLGIGALIAVIIKHPPI